MGERPKRRAVLPDPLTPQQRSFNMSRIRGRDTGPELILRSALHARGLRYRLHAKGLPGTPDIVFPGRRAIIFVHGCFWHGHDCPKGVTPATNATFWREKISRTRVRDQALEIELQRCGWRTLKVWECALRGRARLNLGDLTDQIEYWLAACMSEQDIAGAWGATRRPGAHRGKA
jgi:DNA mismatch endonuclease, patch repair protein